MCYITHFSKCINDYKADSRCKSFSLTVSIFLAVEEAKPHHYAQLQGATENVYAEAISHKITGQGKLKNNCFSTDYLKKKDYFIIIQLLCGVFYRQKFNIQLEKYHLHN